MSNCQHCRMRLLRRPSNVKTRSSIHLLSSTIRTDKISTPLELLLFCCLLISHSKPRNWNAKLDTFRSVLPPLVLSRLLAASAPQNYRSRRPQKTVKSVRFRSRSSEMKSLAIIYNPLSAHSSTRWGLSGLNCLIPRGDDGGVYWERLWSQLFSS